jgi:hypothetical protein
LAGGARDDCIDGHRGAGTGNACAGLGGVGWTRTRS